MTLLISRYTQILTGEISIVWLAGFRQLTNIEIIDLIVAAPGPKEKNLP